MAIVDAATSIPPSTGSVGQTHVMLTGFVNSGSGAQRSAFQ